MEHSKSVLNFAQAFLPYLYGCEKVVFNLREPSSAFIEIVSESFKARLIAELELVAAQNGCSISIHPLSAAQVIIRIESSTYLPF